MCRALCALRVCMEVSAVRWYDSAVTEWGGSGGEGGGGGTAGLAIFSCTISYGIIVPWITSIAGDNRQAAERSGWYWTPTPLWETIWIISRLPADCLWGRGATDVQVGSAVWAGRGGGVDAMTQFDFTGRTGGARVASWITSVTRDGHFILISLFFFFFRFSYSYNVLENVGSDKRIRNIFYFNCSSYFYIE